MFFFTVVGISRTVTVILLHLRMGAIPLFKAEQQQFWANSGNNVSLFYSTTGRMNLTGPDENVHIFMT